MNDFSIFKFYIKLIRPTKEIFIEIKGDKMFHFIEAFLVRLEAKKLILSKQVSFTLSLDFVGHE